MDVMSSMSAYLTAPLQLDKICRTCLSEKGDMRPLFGACLDEMLVSVASIQVKEGDNLPNLMCVQCVLQCSRSYTFKQQCEKSESILRQYMSPEFQQQLNDTLKNDEKTLTTELEFNADHIATVIDAEGRINGDFVTYEGTEPQELEEVKPVEQYSISEDLLRITREATGECDNETTVTEEQPTDSKTSKSFRPGRYRCPKCDEWFWMKVDMKVHLMSHPKELQHICHVCNKAFPELRILKRHLKIHLDKKPHQCDQCDMSFAESSNLSKHKKKHTGELRNLPGKPHLCSVCGRSFKWASSLSKHMKYHTGHKLLACEYCGKQYVEARSLRIHIRSHTGERPYSCDICQKTFTQVCNLEKHLRVHTGEKPFLCNICGKGFTQSGYVGIHMRTHTGARPYICQTCGKAFAGSNSLTIHQRIHTGEKPYECNICGKAFTRNETLVIHKRTHTGHKPHVCTVCNKAFTSSGHLSGHMRTHTGDKPHSCSVCAKKFSDSNSLKMHERTAHGRFYEAIVKSFVCKLCDKTFTHLFLLEAHQAQEHNIEVVDEKKTLVKLDGDLEVLAPEITVNGESISAIEVEVAPFTDAE